MKKFFILFAATCIASVAWSDAVYEPLEIESGFNRDVIAEDTAYYKYSVSYYQPYNSNLNSNYYKTYNHATKEVVRWSNETDPNVANVTSANKERLANETGWPNDHGNPGDRIVNCLTNTYPGLYWELAPYTAENALCLRNMSGCVYSGRFTFKNVGCYQKLYFLTFAGGVQDADRIMTTTVYYSTGEPDVHTFEFLDCASVKAEKRAYITQIYSSGFVKGVGGSGYVYAAVSEMAVDTERLIDSVHFSYTGNDGTGIAIFAVTGLTADIAAPDANSAPHSRAPMRTSNITETSFDVEWDEVSGAASYRLDVATDEDFHHMVGEYNNMTVNGTSAHVEGLNDPDDHEYYWRVRSVDASGGQSASSTPRKTVLVGGTEPSTHEEGNAIEAELEELINVAVPAITITRTLYKDGDFNTLCLPFDLSEEALAASPIAGCELYEFVGAKVLGSSQLDIEMRRTNDLVAGVPYLLKWPSTNEVISKLVFHNVTITKSKGDTIIGVNDEERTDLVRFIGNLDQELLGIYNKNYLFLGAANTLYWPNDESKLKGFRAYFDIPSLLSSPAASPVRQGMPARIVLQEQVTTGVENTSAKFGGCEKHLENGQLVIIRDNIRYNVMGLQLR